jgi:hypothetical protein
MKAPKKRQKPLQVTYGLVTYSLYPCIVRTLYQSTISLAIMMWACTDVVPGTLLSVGIIVHKTGFSTREVRCFFKEMTRLGFIHVIEKSDHEDSILYAVEQYFCIECNKSKHPSVYL